VAVISHDFFPTLLELAGAGKSAAAAATDGVSWVPLLLIVGSAG
jgi:arylsulfatase A-like enzyme